MIQSTVLAKAVATVAGAVYILCRLLAAATPNLLFSVGQSWFHTINLESVRAARPMPMGTFILGLVTSVVFSGVAAYAVAELYNKWEKK